MLTADGADEKKTSKRPTSDCFDDDVLDSCTVASTDDYRASVDSTECTYINASTTFKLSQNTFVLVSFISYIYY